MSELDEVIEAVRDAWSAMEMYCADLDETGALEDALSTLRSMRERAVLGTAWKDGDHFCAGPGPEPTVCEASASWCFAPVCEHDPEPESVPGAQVPALLIPEPPEAS